VVSLASCFLRSINALDGAPSSEGACPRHRLTRKMALEEERNAVE
jgi:hypothetical protein